MPAPLHKHAIRYLGAPWEDGGRGPALDCLGLILAAAADDGLLLPDPADSGPLCWRDCWEEVEEPEPGDMAMWDTEEGAHLGIVAADTSTVIHATRNAGVARTPLTSVEGHFRGFRRLAC